MERRLEGPVGVFWLWEVKRAGRGRVNRHNFVEDDETMTCSVIGVGQVIGPFSVSNLRGTKVLS
jgi:hypothetical protein